MLSRRSFLAGSAALAATAVLPRTASASDADPFGGWTVGIQSYTFRKFPLERALKAMHDLGVRHAEFYRGVQPLKGGALWLCGRVPPAGGTRIGGPPPQKNRRRL